MKIPVETLQQCWFICGPTASGKTSLGIELARQLDGEILSLDSMAIYRQMDIGTAKPSAEEQAQVPHHLIDLIEPHEEFSTAEYVKLAADTVDDILGRGKTPLFVGGTGLYLRSLLRGIFDGPPADWEYRHALEAEAATQDANWLHEQLTKVDPPTAARLHPNDSRRLIRALEIHHLTGEPASAQHAEEILPPELRPRNVFWLAAEREWLYDRINRRVDVMLEAGWLDEVDRLLQANEPLSRTASQALGYRELIDWREGRIETFEETKELICRRTRQFAKRQMTWCRNLVECRALPLPQENLAEQLMSGWRPD
ncbi:MAG: tRNA (adenosine(37)-N6)-dimethylallyltransferase MiaA [Planctomycetaceae bacterium]|nr:tRNA (adenosine(37)-N6)-dimethylallyltransferase MiaA [Planctomycetaceae bacterium]MCB9951568.1 tRNA (adenosine(37)-N6)-dimethylallyltransferase MiaA [Planctomycetaceae bacterium]